MFHYNTIIINIKTNLTTQIAKYVPTITRITYAVDELVENGMDKTFGMGVTEPARKRLPDGSFEYINRVPQYSQETIVVKISKK